MPDHYKNACNFYPVRNINKRVGILKNTFATTFLLPNLYEIHGQSFRGNDRTIHI